MRMLTTPRAGELEQMTTAGIRRHFLVDSLFQPGRIEMAYTDLDRLIVGGIMPAVMPLTLPAYTELRSAYFTEVRESGVMNLGDPGEVTVGDVKYPMERLDCLYIGMQERDVMFSSSPGGQAAFYLLSAPSHRKLPTVKASAGRAVVKEIGTVGSASRRKLVQYIHEDGIESCQLVMGYTSLDTGSVWNTWPPHTHLRRSEVYLYFDLKGETAMHFLGEPGASKHVVVREREAVLSPPWSIHTGVGTGAYSFVWGMAGENRRFDDMDPVDLSRFA